MKKNSLLKFFVSALLLCISVISLTACGEMGGNNNNTGNTNVPVASVSISDGLLTLDVGESYTLTASVKPANATNKAVRWVSSNPQVASVQNGVVTAEQEGTAVITVSTIDGNKFAVCVVTVTSAPDQSLVLSDSEVELEVGQTKQIQIVSRPEGILDGLLVWTTSEPSVALVENGLITACSKGTAIITVSSIDGEYTATCSVTVKEVPEEPEVPSDIKVTDVTLNKEQIELEIGQSETLIASVLPTDATNKNVTWTSSNEKVAIVTNGKVVAVNSGSVVITVKTVDGEYTATCQVTVKEKQEEPEQPEVPSDIKVTDVTLNKEQIELEIGQTETLVAGVLPTDATNKKVTWESSDQNVATVQNGIITAIASGSATITVKTVDGEYTATCQVTVKEKQEEPEQPEVPSDIKVTDVTLNKEQIELEIGQTETLVAGVLPTDATNKKVTWESSDQNVATVQNGIVTAIASGSATITVKTVDGEYTATCQVTVKEKQEEPEQPEVPSDIKVTGITLDKNVLTLEVEDVIMLTASVLPSNATNKNVVWGSSDQRIAKVVNGVVIAMGVGQTTISVTTLDGGFTATCVVVVITPVIEVTGVSLNYSQLNLDLGKTQLLSETVMPANANNKNVTWSSSDDNIVTVSNGLIFAKNSGSAVITVTTEDGGFTASCTVTVKQHLVFADVIDFEFLHLDLIVGDSKLNRVSVDAPNLNYTLVLSSSDESVATVDENGKVTALAKGNAIITATVNGKISDSFTVSVTHGEYLPYVDTDVSNYSSIIIQKGTSYSFNPYISFNSKKFYNATFIYSTDNSNVSITSTKDENGKEVITVVGDTIGKAELTITASWDGLSGIPSLSTTIEIEVIDYLTISINGGATSQVTIYNKAIETLNGVTPTQVDFVISATGNVGNPVVTIFDESIATYSNGKITGTGRLGSTIATVTVVSANNEKFSLYIPITCERAVGDYMTSDKTAYNTVDFNTLDGVIDLSTIFGKEVQLESAYHGRQELIIENNKIVGGIKGTAFGDPEPIVITLYSAEEGYNVEILPYVYKDAVTLSKNYNFSCYDGALFDEDFKLVNVDELFGANAILKQAFYFDGEKQVELEISTDGKSVLGLSIKNAPLSYVLAIASQDKMVVLDVEAYTLIIDEMNDFDYFFVADGTWSFNRSTRWTIVSGMDWNGYYVLANDIDATEYYKTDVNGNSIKTKFKGLENRYTYIQWDNVTYGAATFATLGATQTEANLEQYGLKDKGLTGTFDGRGHVIDKYAPGDGGLFQVVNGGLVKNLGFTNLEIVGAQAIASMALNGASFDNIYIHVNPNKSYKNGSYVAAMSSSFSESVMLKSVVIINECTELSVKRCGALTEYGDLGTSFVNVYVISPVPIMNVASRPDNPTYDAEYVDGIKQNIVFDTDVPGPLNLVPGVCRYTTFAKFVEDVKTNDLDTSTFNEYWTLLEDKVPVFTSSIKSQDLEFYVGNTLVNDIGVPISVDVDTEVTIRYRGAILDIVDTLVVETGSDVVAEIFGCSLYAIKVGKATVTATYTYNGELITKTFAIQVVPPMFEHYETLYFSAGDGEFFEMFDGKLFAIDNALAEIFGYQTTIVSAFDEDGKPLEIVDNKVLGVKTSPSGAIETYIDVYNEDIGYRIYVNSYGLIIDEASDLSFFQLKQPATYDVVTNWTYSFGEGDFLWDGYYVLANNIDASEYGVHDLDNDMITDKYNYKRHVREFAATRLDYLAGDGTEKNGFRGVFDGQGYTISNLTTTASGLLGIVYGEVKNVAFVNSKVSNNVGGVLAYAFAGGAKINDVYVLTDDSTVGNYYSPLVATFGLAVKVNNLIIEDRTALDSQTKTSAYSFGSLTYDGINRGRIQNTALEFGANTFNNVYVISNKALQQTVPANVSGSDVAKHVVGLDAQYIDGVLNEKTYTVTVGSGTNAQTVVVDPVKGIKRYTSKQAMINDRHYNDFYSFDSELWTISNGIPVFNQK